MNTTIAVLWIAVLAIIAGCERKPIYKTSVERWRKYGAGLQPLVDAIEGTTGKASEPKKPKAKAKAKENA